MNCSIIQESLSQWMDGELPLSSETELFAHLSGCEICRSFFRDILTLRQELESIQSIQVPASLDRRVLAIQPSTARQRRYIPWIRPERIYSIRAIGLAMLLSMIFSVFVSSMWYRHSQPQQTIVCLTPLPDVEVTGYEVVAPTPTKGIEQ